MVLVTGTFNIFHAGHLELLVFANNFGPVTVGLNADEYQKRKYGEYAVPLMQRAAVLRACRYVDDVVFFYEDHPGELIRYLKPKYFVRGPDYAGKELPEADALYDVGADLIIHHADKIQDSSKLSPGLPKFILDQLDY